MVRAAKGAVDGVEGDVAEEGVVLMGFDEVDGVVGEEVGGGDVRQMSSGEPLRRLVFDWTTDAVAARAAAAALSHGVADATLRTAFAEAAEREIAA